MQVIASSMSVLGSGLGGSTGKETQRGSQRNLGQHHQADPGRKKSVLVRGNACSQFTLNDIKHFYESL